MFEWNFVAYSIRTVMWNSDNSENGDKFLVITVLWEYTILNMKISCYIFSFIILVIFSIFAVIYPKISGDGGKLPVITVLSSQDFSVVKYVRV